MSNKELQPKLVALIGALLTLLFAYTAVSKLMYFDIFQLRLQRMPYISSHAPTISWAVPFLELLIVGLLWFPRYRTMALYASFILLGLFTLYIGLVLTYSDSIPCSCGGVISGLGWKGHILFNITFMALALLGIILSKKQDEMPMDQNTVQ